MVRKILMEMKCMRYFIRRMLTKLVQDTAATMPLQTSFNHRRQHHHLAAQFPEASFPDTAGIHQEFRWLKLANKCARINQGQYWMPKRDARCVRMSAPPNAWIIISYQVVKQEPNSFAVRANGFWKTLNGLQNWLVNVRNIHLILFEWEKYLFLHRRSYYNT